MNAGRYKAPRGQRPVPLNRPLPQNPMSKSEVVFPFQGLPDEKYLRLVARNLLLEIKTSLNPHNLSEVRYSAVSARRVLSIRWSYDRQGVPEAIRDLRKRGFTPELNDEMEDRPAWVSIRKSFENRSLEFRAEINCAPLNPRAQLRVSVRVVPGLF